MSTYDVYSTDKSLEEEGTWITLVDGSEWKISRASSQRSQKARRNAEKPHRSTLQRAERMGEPVPQNVDDEINMEWMVNGIVLGWKGVTGPNGEELEFNESNMRMIFSDLPDLMLEVVRASGDISNFRQQEAEEEGKS